MNFVANYRLSKVSLILMRHKKKQISYKCKVYRERNQMHNVCIAMHFQCIAHVAFGKIHTRRNQPHIYPPLSRPNPIVWTNRSDRLPAFAGTRLSLFRENKREQIGKNGQFLFPDCLSKKKKKTKKKIEAPTRFQYFTGERTKERHQRILHVPPSVIRRNRNQPRRQAPN